MWGKDVFFFFFFNIWFVNSKVRKYVFFVLRALIRATCHISLSFCVSASVNKGEFSISLHQVTNLAPFAQVVVYTVMPSGEGVADSQDFPIQLCLNNKVQPQCPI